MAEDAEEEGGAADEDTCNEEDTPTNDEESVIPDELDATEVPDPAWLLLSGGRDVEEVPAEEDDTGTPDVDEDDDDARDEDRSELLVPPEAPEDPPWLLPEEEDVVTRTPLELPAPAGPSVQACASQCLPEAQSASDVHRASGRQEANAATAPTHIACPARLMMAPGNDTPGLYTVLCHQTDGPSLEGCLRAA